MTGRFQKTDAKVTMWQFKNNTNHELFSFQNKSIVHLLVERGGVRQIFSKLPGIQEYVNFTINQQRHSLPKGRVSRGGVISICEIRTNNFALQKRGPLLSKTYTT